MFRDLSERAIFESALSDAATLSAKSSLWWRVTSSGLTVRLDEQAVSEHFENKDDLDLFERTLQNEIVWGLEAALAHTPVKVALTMFYSRDKLDEAKVAEVQARVDRIREVLLTPEFLERWLLRKTVKGMALDEVRWDINVKKHDLGEGRVGDIPFASLEFALSEGASFDVSFPQARFLYGRNQNKAERFTFSCHPAELDALIRDLQVLRDNFRRLGDKE